LVIVLVNFKLSLFYLNIKITFFTKKKIVQKDYFHRREFCFTLKDDVYLRYQTFNDWNEFEKELQKRTPFKIDIGAVYNHIVIN